MSTSDPRHVCFRGVGLRGLDLPSLGERGFSLVELLVGLALALVVASAALTLWTGLERAGSDGGDHAILLLQSRVAIARMERDFRWATALGCPFQLAGPLIEGQAGQVVFLERSDQSGVLALVEWELVGGSLMRRKGACPAARPATITHSLYSDNKTMLEGVTSDSRLRYYVGGSEIPAPVASAELALVDEVRVDGSVILRGSAARAPLAASCLVGR